MTRLQMVTPLPPAQTGIAQYSRDLLAAIDGRWPLDVVAEPGRRFRFDRRKPSVYQIGNSGFHRAAFRHALEHPGVLVLHDVALHMGRRGELLRERRWTDYRELLATRYGLELDALSNVELARRMEQDAGSFPLSEDYIERALVTLVHSHYAKSLVREMCPGADVGVIPMGVPLPFLYDQGAARSALDIASGAYVIAAISHINPYKRMPIVMQALRMLIETVPEAQLVVAGSVAPGIDVARMARQFDVAGHVTVMGYVDDLQARLLARAADVCINLRYPSVGETSASLLRLLGAGRPVVVTAGGPMDEYPDHSLIKVPVDRVEAECISESLALLAHDSELRQRAGSAARSFIADQHSMQVAVEGNRVAWNAAFGLELPEITVANLIEPEQALPQPQRSAPQVAFDALDSAVADQLVRLSLEQHEVTLSRVARRLRRLRGEAIGRKRNKWRTTR